MGFPRQEYRGRLPFPTPGHLPNPAQGLKLGLLLCRQILYHLSHQGSPNNTLVFQSCLTLCDPVDCSPPGSSLHGHPQARILELVSMPSSRGPFQPRDPTCIFYISCIGRQVLYHKCYLGSPWRTMQIKIYSLPRSMMDRQPTHIA